MRQERHEIEFMFYKVINRKLTVCKFEKWLYGTDEENINRLFGEGFYFQLIDLNYKDKYVLNDLEKIIYQKVSFAQFEKEKLNFLLESITNNTMDLIESLERCYELYCDGYNFLRFLGLSFILNGLDKMPKLKQKSQWNIQRFELKRKRLNKIYPKIRAEAIRISSFLMSGEIQIKEDFEYEDLRKEDDKKEIYNVESMF